MPAARLAGDGPAKLSKTLLDRLISTTVDDRSCRNIPKVDRLKTTPRQTGNHRILRVEAASRATSDGCSTPDFGSLSQELRVLHVDTKISDRVLSLGVTEQYLNGADIAQPSDRSIAVIRR